MKYDHEAFDTAPGFRAGPQSGGPTRATCGLVLLVTLCAAIVMSPVQKVKTTPAIAEQTTGVVPARTPASSAPGARIRGVGLRGLDRPMFAQWTGHHASLFTGLGNRTAPRPSETPASQDDMADLFSKADRNRDGLVSSMELADLLGSNSGIAGKP